MLIGYARVSTLQQETALQWEALKRAGVKRVYEEKRSGVGVARPVQHGLRSVSVLVTMPLVSKITGCA